MNDYCHKYFKDKASLCPHCPLFKQEVFLTFPEEQPWGRIIINCPNCGVVYRSQPFGYTFKPIEIVHKDWNNCVKTIS